jgi:hypothetical protein
VRVDDAGAKEAEQADSAVRDESRMFEAFVSCVNQAGDHDRKRERSVDYHAPFAFAVSALSFAGRTRLAGGAFLSVVYLMAK